MKGDEITTAKFKMVSLVLVIAMLLQILMPVIMPLKSLAANENGIIETSLGTMIIRKMETTEEGVIPIEIYIEGTDIYGISGELSYDRTIFEELQESDIEIKPAGWSFQAGELQDNGESYTIDMCNLLNSKGYSNFTAAIIKLKVKDGADPSLAVITLEYVAISDIEGNDTWEETEGAGFTNTYTLPEMTEVKKYSVTYNDESGEATNMPSNATDISAGTSYTIAEGPKREGYVFTGWQTKAGASYVAGESYEINSNLDLYAQWRELNKYTITYNKNATDEVTNMPTTNGTKTEGVDYTIAPAPSRTGYTFDGWNTSADGTGTSYVAESLYRTDENLELFAKWTPVRTTLTVNPNGGVWEGFSSAQNYEQDYKTTKQIPNPTSGPKGHLIRFDAGDGGTAEELIKEQTTSFDKWTLTDGGTLSGNTYTFGTESGTLTANYVGDSMILPTASKSGCRFNGWYTAPTGGTLVGQAGEAYLPDGPRTLFAQWEEIGYELTVNPAGGTYKGTTEPTKEQGKYEDIIVLETPKAPTGYTITLDNDGTITTVEQKKTFNRWIKSGKGTLEENIYTFEEGNGTVTATYTPRGVELENPEEKPGYEFEGWYTLRTGGTKVESGFMPEEDTTLYAHWKAKTFTVTFNPGEGATVTPSTKEVTHGGKYGELPTPVKTGKTFTGWYNGETPITAESTVEIIQNTTLTARWSDSEYTLTIDLNGGKVNGSLTTEALRGKYNETVTLPIVTEGPEGFTVTLDNNDGITTAPTIIKQTTRLDKWTRTNGTVLSGTTSYTFDASNDKITASYVGEGVTLNPATRTNYKFLGWFTQAEGGEQKTTGFIPTENTTLYAHWEGDKHKITFNPGTDATVSETERIVEYGKTYGELPIPVKTGKTFVGWFNGEEEITADRTVEITQDTELVAKWIDTQYKLTINLNGGKVGENTEVPQITGIYEQTVDLPTVTEGPDGFTVTLDNNDGTNTTGSEVQTTRLNKWIKEDGTELTGTTSYTFNASDDTITASYVGEGVTLNPVTRTNYKFLGWFTQAEGGEKKEPGYVPTENITLYAHWEGDKYTITFDTGDGSTPETKEVEHGKPYGELPEPEQPGKRFEGWFDGEEEITEETPVEITEDTTLTAKWSDIEYNLTIDLNGGKVGESTTVEPIKGIYEQEVTLPTVEGPEGFTVTLDKNDGTNTTTELSQTTRLDKWTKADGTELEGTTTYTFGTSDDTITASYVGEGVDLEDAERPGYTFKGWYKDTTDETTKVETGFIPTENTTLYAHWEAEKYTITFKAGEGATVDPESKEVTFGEKYGTLPTPEKPGGNFEGWYIGETPITSESIVEITKDTELIAKWTGEKYTLTINLNGGTANGSETVAPIEGEYGDIVTLPTVIGPNGFTVTFDNNNGTGATREERQPKTLEKWTKTDGTALEGTTYTFGVSSETITASYVESAINVADPVRLGYTFKGWYTQAEGGDKVEMPYLPESDIRLYAQWKGEEHTVTFDAGEGVTVEPSSKQVELGKAYGELPTPEKTGYEFKGWFTDISDETTQVTEETIFETRADVTLTAGWEARKYTITFNAGEGATATPTTKEVEYGKTYGDLATATKPGATLVGWFNGETQVRPEDTVEITEDIELTAKWTNTQYTLTINLNGGKVGESTTVEPITGIYGQTVDLPTVTGPEGFTVTLNNNDGTNTTTQVQQTTRLNKWTKADGTELEGTSTYTFGESSETITASYVGNTVPLEDPAERTGYEFKGWFTDATNGVERVEPYTPTASETLYAHWEAKKYTVNFDAGEGATVTPDPIEVTFGGKYGTLPTPEKPGGTFEGWYIGETEITADSTVEITEETTLTAKWTDTQYTLTINLNGGKVGESETVEAITGKYYQTVDLPEVTGPEGFTVTLNNNDGITSSREIKLPKTLDKWTKADGTELSSTTTYTFGASNDTITASYAESSVELEDPERANYVFKGWFTDATNGTKVESGFTPTEDTILYAHWEGEKHTITFNAGEGATPETTTKEVEYGKPYGDLPTPTKPGATFEGWFDGDTLITDTTLVEITEDTELTAKWTNTQYTLTIDLNGGKVGENETVEPITGIYGQTVNLPTVTGPEGFTVTLDNNDGTTTTPTVVKQTSRLDKWTKADGTELTGTTTYTFGESDETITASYVGNEVTLENPTERPGYEFKGWYTQAEGGTQKETEFMPDADITLYAKWEARKYTVTFNPGTGATVTPRTKQVTFGEVYGTLPTPNRSGYDFEGWFNGEEEITSESTVEITSDTTLTAKWGGLQYTVTFDYGDGTSTSKTVKNEETYGELPNPTKEGYEFDGWYDENNNKITSETIVELTDDITLYAKFIANEYIVVFKNDDGSTIDAITVKHGERAEYEGETPQKNNLQKGYQAEFTGWTNADKLQNVTENITVTATYTVTPIIYTITYKNTDNVDNSQNPTSYTVEDENIILNDLADQGEYEFKGWYTSEEDDEEGEKVTSIDTSKLENIILYARWDESKLYLRSKVYKIGENDIDRYEPNDVYLDKISPETTVAQFIKNCKTNGTIIVLDKDNQKLGQDDIVGTEMTINVTKDNEEINLIAVVMGDTDGNGEVTPTDLSDINKVVLKVLNLEGAKLKAADIDDSQRITPTDLSDVNKTILGLIKLIYSKK